MLSRVASGTARLFGYSVGTARPRLGASPERHDASATLKLGQSNSRRSVIHIIALVVVAKALSKRTKPALFSNTRHFRRALAVLFREPCRDNWNAPAAKLAPDLRHLCLISCSTKGRLHLRGAVSAARNDAPKATIDQPTGQSPSLVRNPALGAAQPALLLQPSLRGASRRATDHSKPPAPGAARAGTRAAAH